MNNLNTIIRNLAFVVIIIGWGLTIVATYKKENFSSTKLYRGGICLVVTGTSIFLFMSYILSRMLDIVVR